MRDIRHTVTLVDDAYLEWMFSSARQRLIIIAPGMSASLARVVADRWRILGSHQVMVTLDVDAEVCRLGYGEIEAVTILAEAARTLGTTLNPHAGVRIGVVIADDETLIYAPTPLCVEAGPYSAAASRLKPNAVRIGPPPPELAQDIGLGPHGVRGQTIGLDAAEKSRIRAVEEDLAAIPPQAFNLGRILRGYTSRLEFVELRLKGCQLKRRSVKITPELMGIADAATQRLLKSTFSLVDADESPVWGEELVKIKEFIVNRYLVHLPGFGLVLRVQDRPAFELAVRTLRKMLNRARVRKCARLQASIDRRIHKLEEALLPALTRHPPPHWKHDLVCTPLRELLRKKLTALTGTAREQLSDARVDLRYKGVTLETLKDPAFIAAARKGMPDLDNLHDELDVTPAVKKRAG